MKKIYIILIFVTMFSKVFSQVGGISASKLATLCTQTVPEKGIEFEPAFSFSRSSKYFDNNAKVQPLFKTNDSLQFESGFGFRFSYGAIKNLEIGTTMPFDLSIISLGLKYKLPFGNNTTYAIVSRLNSPIGNSIINKNKRNIETANTIVGGVVISESITEKFNIDFDTQYQIPFQKTEENLKSEKFFDIDIGYYAIENVQTLVGFNYYTSSFDNSDLNQSILTINTGITIERADDFILVMSVPVDVYGKNIQKSVGFTFALTIIID